MKNFFNNIWCVSGLGLIAVIYFAYSVALPLLDRFSGANTNQGDMIPIEELENSSTSQDSITSHSGSVDRESVTWFTNLVRDPFSQPVNDSPPELGAAYGVAATRPAHFAGKTLQHPVPKLSGLFHRAADSVAVIDGELLSIGDTISGFKLSAINRSSVVVERNGREYALIIEPNR